MLFYNNLSSKIGDTYIFAKRLEDIKIFGTQLAAKAITITRQLTTQSRLGYVVLTKKRWQKVFQGAYFEADLCFIAVEDIS